MNCRRWRGYEEQVANACDRFVNLTPASPVPAMQTRSNYEALLPGQAVPLIWERVADDCYDDDPACFPC